MERKIVKERFSEDGTKVYRQYDNGDVSVGYVGNPDKNDYPSRVDATVKLRKFTDFTDDEKSKIIEEYDTQFITYRELARKYHCNILVIERIMKNRQVN